jgi:hypothetical protein
MQRPNQKSRRAKNTCAERRKRGRFFLRCTKGERADGVQFSRGCLRATCSREFPWFATSCESGFTLAMVFWGLAWIIYASDSRSLEDQVATPGQTRRRNAGRQAELAICHSAPPRPASNLLVYGGTTYLATRLLAVASSACNLVPTSIVFLEIALFSRQVPLPGARLARVWGSPLPTYRVLGKLGVRHRQGRWASA